MDQTVDQIEAHIDQTRARLGSNVRELEEKVEAATDWQAQFRAHPYAMLGAACVGGVLIAATLSSRRAPRSMSLAPTTGRSFNPRRQIGDLWDDVATALLGVASTKVQHYIAEMVPDFDEHYARAAQQRASVR